MSKTEKHKWRVKLEAVLARCEVLQGIMDRRGLTGLGFEIRWSWTIPQIDRVLWEPTLEEFSQQVERVSAALDFKPDTVKAQRIGGQLRDGEAPDFEARWLLDEESLPDVAVSLRAFGPRGCKVHPGHQFVAQQEQPIHPECAAALKEMER